MRLSLCVVIFALTAAASSAFACAPYQYVNAVAQGHIRAANGDWVPFSVEVDRSLIRLEYQSSKSPTGRFAVVGNISHGWAYGFPVGPGWTAKAAPQRTTMKRLLDQAGLPIWPLRQYVYSTDPTHRFRDMKCRLTEVRGGPPYYDPAGARVCVHDVRNDFEGGLPLYATDTSGKRVLEMAKVEIRPVKLVRFNPPKPKPGPLVVAARTPTTCSG